MSALDRHSPSGPTRLPRWVTRAMAGVYAWEAGRRSRRFDAGIGVERIDRPVVSVGNLSAGGTGKSPVVRAIVRLLRDGGHRPAIAMRGYKAAPGEVSDEQAEHAAELPGVPIVARPDRIAGLRDLFATPEGESVDCVVLDDGFQHRRLARDLDVVLIDATRPAHRDALLPGGFLREPVSALSRADVLLITRSGLVDERALEGVLAGVRAQLREGTPVFAVAERWSRVDRCESGEMHEESPDALGGTRLGVCCGIGNPGALIRSAEQAGVDVVDRIVLADHAAYDDRAIDRMIAMGRACEGVLTTGKDWVKIGSRWRERGAGLPPVWVPRTEVCFNKQWGPSARDVSGDLRTREPGSGGGGDASSAFRALLYGAIGDAR